MEAQLKRGSLSSSGGTTVAVSHFKPLSAKLPPKTETVPHPGWQDGTILGPGYVVPEKSCFQK